MTDEPMDRAARRRQEREDARQRRLDATPPSSDARMGAYLLNAMEIIDEHGVMIQGVFPNDPDDEPGFTYTVGLTARAWPEVIIRGLPHETAGRLLNDLAKRSTPPVAGLVLDDVLAGDMQVKFVESSIDDVTMPQRLYPLHEVRALQMLWPDTEGRLPDDPECKAVYRWAQGFGPRPDDLSEG